MNARQYFKTIRKKFCLTFNEVVACSETNQLNICHELTLNETVIRIHINLGAPMIRFTTKKKKH